MTDHPLARHSETNRQAAAVSLSNVSKTFPGATALDGVSLLIQKFERVALIGPSGAGKTTFLHSVAGLVKPDSGTIAILGHSLGDMQPGAELASKVGVIHQQFDLVPHLSVKNNVLAGRLGRRGLLSSLGSLLFPFDEDVAKAALDRVGISHKARERTADLSGGEQQRVAIARLLVQNPEVILADEPVASLDPARSIEVMRLLSDIALSEGKTLICAVHSVDLVCSFFERVVGLRDGKLQFDLQVEMLTEGHMTALFSLEDSKESNF